MALSSAPSPRDAHADDIDQLLSLWRSLFDEKPEDLGPWRDHARTWFEGLVDNRGLAYFPVVEIDGRIVACAIGTLELGVPNPQCLRGRVVRLANVFTLPEHRGQGYGSVMVDFVVDWARMIHADRVDLSSTPEGQRIYTRSGFVLTSAPRMKLVLEAK
jgi:GNAT superfamily N-acetyltransferase